MITCFEGPSAVGKTKLCERFSEDFQIVPEANLLFQKDENTDKFWYHEMQLMRYQMCDSQTRDSILDGDIFQPIWYNWIYGYPSEFLTIGETHRFYLENINKGHITFPDLYFVFAADEKELYKRKETDQDRKRRNFEKHLKMIEPQLEYFRFLKERTPLQVEFVKYQSIDQARNEVSSLMTSLAPRERDDVKILESIIDWLD